MLALLLVLAATLPPRPLRRPDLAIGPNDVRYLPAFPKDGDRVGVAVTIHNRGSTEARDVLVRCGIAGGVQDSIGIDIRGQDSVVVRWRVDLTGPGPWRLGVSVIHPSDRNPGNNATVLVLGEGRPLRPADRSPSGSGSRGEPFQ